MAKKEKLQLTNLLITDSTEKNPFSVTPDMGALENFVPNYGRLIRVPFMPPFVQSASASSAWGMMDFQFTRNNAREHQFLIFKADGKIYKRQAGMELEIFPGKTSFAPLIAKPVKAVIADRLHVSDGSQYLIYDGWDWFTGGLIAPVAVIGTALVAGVLTGNYKIAVTAVHQVNGVRINESSRSPITAFIAPAAQNIRVTKPADLPARATHWSVYISELSNSDILRRSVTVDINTATTDISAEPASTSPTMPIRNDPVLPTGVMEVWKNRIAMRSEQNPDQLWFTAFGEVKGLLNGAAEESLPGRGSASVSDIVNSWTLPDAGEPMTAALWYEEYLLVFSTRNTYVIRGEGALLDARSLRDFFPTHIFSFGAAGPDAVCGTPYGLAFLTKERNLWLWPGTGELLDIGKDFQGRINSLSDTQLQNVSIFYWTGGGNTWLLIGLADRVEVFDFGIQTKENPIGVPYSIGNQNGLPGNPVSFCNFNLNGRQAMIVGCDEGSVRQFDSDADNGITVCQPAHLGLSFKLGSVYLGATVQNSPNCTARTGSFQPTEGSWSECKYIELFHKSDGDTDATGIRATAPAVNAYFDDINPQSPDGPISQILVSISNLEKRAWLRNSLVSSSVGVLAKRLQVEINYTSTKTDGQARPQLLNDEIWQLGFAWEPRPDLTL